MDGPTQGRPLLLDVRQREERLAAVGSTMRRGVLLLLFSLLVIHVAVLDGFIRQSLTRKQAYPVSFGSALGPDFATRRRQEGRVLLGASTLPDIPTVGASVTGEVFEHDVSSETPRVLFLLKNPDGSTITASMPSSSLSWQEKMTLQVGSLIPLKVCNVDGEGNVEVGLTTSGFQSSKDGIMNVMKSQDNSGGSKGEGSMKQTGLPSTISSSGLLLNTMKTGMKLEGVVASCTPYAAFMNVGVVRSSRGGRYIEVNGMLHRDDMHSDVQIMSNNRKRLSSSELEDKGMVGKGRKMTVYVKEVYKNSGRFTLTMDPTIEKQQIIDMRQQIKVEGNERRRARRMRRILDEVNEGDTVTGIVQEVVNEGVLVSISNLGSLNITGLMSKRDLPKQFQVPPDLKESFQNQLLSQDFVAGREVSCGVVKINQKSNARMKYNLKLVFEDFGSRGVLTNMEDDVPDEALEMLNEGELKDFEADMADMDEEELLKDEDTLSLGLDDGHGNNVDPLDYSSADLEEVWENNDMREIYNELCEGEPMLKASNLYAWGDIQDMVENEEVSQGQVKHAIEEAIQRPVPSDLDSLMLSFEQFAEIVAVIQDFLDENATKDRKMSGAHAQQSKEDIAEFGRIPVSMMESAQTSLSPSMMTGTSKSSTALSASNSNTDEEGGLLEFDENSINALEDDAIEEVAREVYDELRGSNAVVTVDNLLNWSDIQEMLNQGHLSRKELDLALTQVLRGDGTVSFAQFFELVNVLEDLANPIDENDNDSNDITMEVDSDEYEEIDEEAETEMLTEIYKDLLKATGTRRKSLTLEEVRNWEELNDLELSDKEFVALLQDVGVETSKPEKARVTNDQFIAFVRSLDETEMAIEDSSESAEEISESQQDKEILAALSKMESVDDDDEVLDMQNLEEDEVSEEENREFMEGVFLTLGKKGGSRSITVNEFMAWDELKDMLSDGLLDTETVSALLAEVGIDTGDKKAKMDFDMFYTVVTMLDETLEAMDGIDMDNLEDDDDISVPIADSALVESTAESISEVNYAEGEEDMDAFAKEVFTELAAGKDSLSVDEFKKWEQVSELLENSLVAENTVEVIINEICEGRQVMTFDEFNEIVDLLDQAAEAKHEGHWTDEEEEEEEEDMMSEAELEAAAREIFDELKNSKTNKVSIKKFKAWEAIKDAISEGDLSKGALKQGIKAVDPNESNELDFDQFKALMDYLEDAMTADDNDDNTSDIATATAGSGFGNVNDAINTVEANSKKSEVDVDIDEMTELIFDELRGRKATLAVNTFKEWEDVKDMVDKGQLKHSTLEKAIMKAGSLESGEMNLEQFSVVLDALQKDIDAADLTAELKDDMEDISTSDKVMTVEDEDHDVPLSFEGEDLSEEEEAEIIYNDLKGGKDTLPLIEFLKWEDVQELLEVGALTKDNLATAIENVGLTVENGDLSFSQFYDLLQILDGMTDATKLPGDYLEEEEEIDEEGMEDIDVSELIEDDDDEEEVLEMVRQSQSLVTVQ